jgi:hypothetical protein
MGVWQREGGVLLEVVYSQFAVTDWPRVTLVLLAIAQDSGRREERMLRSCIVSMSNKAREGESACPTCKGCGESPLDGLNCQTCSGHGFVGQKTS